MNLKHIGEDSGGMAPWGPESEGEVCVDKGVLGHLSRSDHSGGPATSTQSL